MQRFSSDAMAWTDAANILSRKVLQQIAAGSRGLAADGEEPGSIEEARGKPGRSGKF